MEIRYYQKEDVIETYADWERVFSAAKPKDWKKGRSAQSLAAFMMKKDGFACIRSLVGEAIGKPIDEIEKVTIEGRVAFDNYNHSREHDLAVVARTESNQSVFIGVEAKVDESFGGACWQASPTSPSLLAVARAAPCIPTTWPPVPPPTA